MAYGHVLELRYHFANAADVDAVLVEGRVLMEGRQVPHQNLADILIAAEAEADRVFSECGRMECRRQAPESGGAPGASPGLTAPLVLATRVTTVCLQRNKVPY